MERKIRVAHFGCGHVSSFIFPDYYLNGVEPVAVFEVNKDIIGKDAGEYFGIGHKGLTVQDSKNAREILAKVKPDLAVIAASLSVESIKDMILMCADLGIDVLTPTEPAYYPWNNNTRFVAKEINQYAKEHGVTVCATGSPDSTTNNLIDCLLAQTADVKKIETSQLYNIEGEVPYLSDMFGAGISKEEFDKKFLQFNKLTAAEQQSIIDSGKYYPKDGWRICGSVAAQLGLHVTELKETRQMLTNEEDHHSKTLGKTIKAGDPTGSMNTVTAHTEEGIDIIAHFGAKLFAPGEKHMHLWKVEGRPTVKMYIDMANSEDEFAVTAAALINRIPSVIDADAGYKEPDNMLDTRYHFKPLNEYVQSK